MLHMSCGCGLPDCDDSSSGLSLRQLLASRRFCGIEASGRPSITMFQQGAQSTSRTVLALDIDVIPCHPKPPGVVAKFSPS